MKGMENLPSAGTGSPGLAGRIAASLIDSKLTPLLMLGALLTGVVAVALTPREEEPQIVVPMIDVMVALPGAAPAEVEKRVTLPLEKRLYEISGVEYVYSVSRPGEAMVTARFAVGDDPDRSLVRVFEKLAAGLATSPPGASPPLVKARSIDDVPVLVLTLSSARYSSAELRRVAGELAAELAPVEGVTGIEILGGERRQVRIELDGRKLAAAGIDPAYLLAVLEQQNASLPAGFVARGGSQVALATGGFLRDAGEVAALVVGSSGGRPIRLRDVARVEDGTEEPASYVELGRAGQGFAPAVTLTIAKKPGYDAHQVVGRLQRLIQQLRPALLPAEVELTVARDYGASAAGKADELLLHLGIAVVAVSLMLALTLGLRGAAVVLVSVPLSFALTLLVYYLFGYTLNRVTLFALVFVSGIVVDDSIIVIENMVRHLARRAGDPLRAAIEAIDEVGNPTLLATFTVIASLMPMALVRGLMGPYMRPMPVGASLAMLFSLLVALVAAPYLGLRLLRAHGGESGGPDAAPSAPLRLYRRLLERLIASRASRWGFLAAIVALLAASILLVPARLVKVKMLPFDDKNEMQVVIDLPEGTTLERTAEVAREIARTALAEPEVADATCYAGIASPINFNGLVRHYDLRRGANLGDVAIRFHPKSARRAQSHDLALRLRPAIEEIAAKSGASLKIAEVPPGPPVLSTLVAEVYGPTEEARREVARQVLELFRAAPNVGDADWTVEAEQAKEVYAVDHEKAALSGVSPLQAAAVLRTAVAGTEAGSLHLENERERVGLLVTLPRGERAAGQLGALELRSAAGAGVPLSEVVEVETRQEDTSLHRKNLRPVVYVLGEVKGAQASPVYAISDLADSIAALRGPDGRPVVQLYSGGPESSEVATVKWDGEWQITYEVFRDLGLAFAGVLVLIYLLIVGWFRSFRVPLVMMTAIPLSLVGILPAHWLFGAFFTATSMIGFIALAGIMVRNSVLLIDFVDLALARGASLEEAVVEAALVRLRPILLTAGAVAVGSVVILLDPIFQGLAIAMLAGSAASTLLTLVVVPVVHYAFES